LVYEDRNKDLFKKNLILIKRVRCRIYCTSGIAEETPIVLILTINTLGLHQQAES
jgi:hypothetical protein